MNPTTIKILCLFSLLACSSPKNTSREPIVTNPISPDYCLVKAKLIDILPINLNSSGLCKEFPCVAKVLIIENESCGFTVAKSPKTGDTLDIYFPNTLQNTKTILPELNLHNEGLSKGEKFIAEVKIQEKMFNQISYTIYNYTKY